MRSTNRDREEIYQIYMHHHCGIMRGKFVHNGRWSLSETKILQTKIKGVTIALINVGLKKLF